MDIIAHAVFTATDTGCTGTACCGQFKILNGNVGTVSALTAADAGTTVLAASSGTVLAVQNDDMMGTTVVIDHGNGYQTTYANLQARPTVVAGDSVSAGQIIGAVGTTAAAESAQGPHLHFSVSKDGDAVDPGEYLKK